MTLTAITLLCFAALLPFPGLGDHEHCFSDEKKTVTCFSGEKTGEQELLVKVDVTNKYINKIVSYSTTVPEGMPMFGVLNKLKDTQSFTFTYSIDKSYGIYLESVNGLAKSTVNKTYWELLTKKGQTISPLKVGIGCYQPKKNEIFIMNYTTWG